MRLKVIACKVFNREIGRVIADSPNTIDVSWLRQGLHDTPDVLREAIQREINLIDDGTDMHTQLPPPDDEYEAIVLAYGLCSNAVCGLRSKRYRLVVPRAHDCVAMIMGSHARYRDYFDAHPGTYWYTPGWIEQTTMPGPERVERTRARYVEQYGEENADYLMEMEQEWLRRYDRCAYLSWRSLDRPEYRRTTREAADYLGWKHDAVEAEPGWIERLLSGEWRSDEVLVLPPESTAEPSYDESIIRQSR